MDSESSENRISSSEKDEDENDALPFATTSQQQSARYYHSLIEGSDDEKEEEKEDLRNYHYFDDDQSLCNGHNHSQYDDDDNFIHHDNFRQDDDDDNNYSHNNNDDDDQGVAKLPPPQQQDMDEDEHLYYDTWSTKEVASLPTPDHGISEGKTAKSCGKGKVVDEDDDDDEKNNEGPDQLRLERARESQVIRPGAVAVRGISSVLRSTTSTYASDSDEASHNESPSSPMNGHDNHHHHHLHHHHHHHHVAESEDVVVVVPDEDVEQPDEELEARIRLQEEERDEQFAAQVREIILQHTAQAEVVTEIIPSVKVKANSTSRRRWVIALIAGAFLMIVVIIVPIVVTQTRWGPCHRHRHNETINATNSTPSEAVGAEAPFSSCYFCLNLTTNLTSDFANETNQTIFGLLQTGQNHTLMPEFLAYARLSTWAENENITLFAPLDISFEILPVPYAYYQSSFYWIHHLITIMDYHIVVQPLTEAEIFQLSHLPTLSGPNITVHGKYSVLADDAKILLADIPTTNGYIQVPDRVLIPDDLQRTLFEVANDLYNKEAGFATFGRLFNLSGLEATLSERFYFYNGLTLLLPTDAAFEKLDPHYLGQLMSDARVARDFVAYHLVPINVYQELIISIVQQINFLSLNRLALWFSATDFRTPNIVYVNAVPIQESIFAGDGLIHVVDEVILPPTIGDLLVITANVTISPRYDFKLFVDLAAGPGRLSSLFFNASDETVVAINGLTVFAPMQEAFDHGIATSQTVRRIVQNPSRWWLHVRNLIENHCIDREVHNSDLFVGTLTLRAISGFNISLQVFSEGNITNDDMEKLNLVDGNYYAYPNFTIDVQANVTLNNLMGVNGLIYGIDRLLLPPWADLSIYETVLKWPQLRTLASLIKFANLTGLLNVTAGLTLLAPNNTAFAGVDVTNATFVRDLLLRHILLDVVYFADSNATSVESLNNQNYEVRLVNNQIEVGGSAVINSAILASNGVVQEVDRIIS